MSISRHFGSICKGAGIGFLIGLASIATVDKKTLAILQILSKPVELVTWVAQKTLGLGDGTTALMGWLGLAVYWMILGALIGWGVSVLLAKGSGDE
ncbi:MAG: hypothetical protein C5B50_06300 [Verrucomicrobia bacterium]|nr:MAG: hypothetical protein C5B50_06300 [Verrucomicrobiota bacterium]